MEHSVLIVLVVNPPAASVNGLLFFIIIYFLSHQCFNFARSSAELHAGVSVSYRFTTYQDARRVRLVDGLDR